MYKPIITERKQLQYIILVLLGIPHSLFFFPKKCINKKAYWDFQLWSNLHIIVHEKSCLLLNATTLQTVFDVVAH